MADTTINGRKYQVGEVLATDALRLKFQVMKNIGAGVERLPVILKGTGNASDEDKEMSRAAAVAAFTDIFKEADPETLIELIRNIVKFATVERSSGAYEQVDIDLDFTQDRSSLYPVVIFVLKEVLSDFFTGVLGNGFQTVKIPTG